MNYTTRYYRSLNKVLKIIKNKSYILKNKILQLLFFLFLGFFSGSLFGTLIGLFRNWVFWDGILIFALLLAIEFINFLIYKKNIVNFYDFKLKNQFFQNLNSFKVGLLLGFFIDAFKVGS